MKKTVFAALGAMWLFSSATFVANAATAATDDEVPAIEFHTTIYDTYGDQNDFSLVLGSTAAAKGEVIYYDCGFGEQEAVLDVSDYDTDNEESSGTYMSCRVSSEGIVKIYIDDPTWIDWVDFHGCYIDEITFNGTTAVKYLNLSHNELKSLDLSNLTNIQMLYLTDNPFTESPLVVGPKSMLSILEMNNIGAISPSFNLSDYPTLYTLDAWATKGLTWLDPSKCTELRKLSIDGTDVASLDVSKNPLLQILNISDTRITEIDLSNNPDLYQFYCTHESSVNEGYKLKSLDLSHNPELFYLFCTGNDFETLDVTNNTKLGSLTARKNRLTTLDVSKNPNLFCLNISDNYIGFSQLPWPVDSVGNELYTEYDYSQRNYPVNPSYPVGSVLDFSDKVLRDYTVTQAVMYSVSEDDPENPQVVSDAYYDYADGKITLKAIPTDSVYVQFSNDVFSAYPHRTAKFKVKSTSDYGKPYEAFTFNVGVSTGTSISFGIGVSGASDEHPQEFFVDFGDGEQKRFTTTNSDGSQINATGNVSSSLIRVYLNDGTDVTGLTITDTYLTSVILTNLRSLRNLTLSNDQLYQIDLQWNRCLEHLDLSHNNLSYITLAANNQNYGKNALTHVDLSYNSLSTFEWNENFTVTDLNLSHNKLSELSLSKNTKIERLNIGYNNYTYFTTADCSGLLELDVEGNQLSEITLPSESILEKLNVSNNNFTLATLPDHGDLLEANYIYAPQQEIGIPAKAPGIDLSEQDSDGNTTFTWKKVSDGSTLIEGTDYSNEDGLMRFINTEVGNVYCEITNPKFPAFTGENVLKTSVVEAAGMPTNVVATFETVYDDETVALSLASSVANNAIYIDWAGNGFPTQYVTGTTYTQFTATTHANAVVKVYSYDDNDKITVFSMSGASLNSMDASNMKSLICLNVTNAGLYDDDLILPESTGLQELILPANRLTTFDFSKYSSLRYLNLAGNNIAELDLSNTGNIQQLFLGENELTSATFGKNTAMWSLFLNDNQLTSVDISKLTNLTQIDFDDNELTSIDFSKNKKLTAVLLNNNKLDSIDVTPLKNITNLQLSGNRFRFSTLPLASSTFSSTYYTYKYGNQAAVEIEAVDGVVDLSSEAVIDGTATTYYWVLGEVELDDDGYLNNEVLESEEDNAADPEYRLSNGVTTFCYSQDQPVSCMMTNDLFSDLYLTTNTIMIELESGIENIAADASAKIVVKVAGNTVSVYTDNAASASLYNAAGALTGVANFGNGVATFNGVATGVYVVTVNDKAVKVAVR
jgi:Leucine-rich repeat (LRR) protein